MDTILHAISTPLITGILVSIIVWRIQKRLERKQQARDKLFFLMVDGGAVNMKLSKATAEAVRDQKCNGNMTQALCAVEAHQQEYDRVTREIHAELLRG